MPPRPNSSTDEILVKTIELIAEHDIAGVSVEMVAEASNVSKATIYRRWQSREDLIFEAMTYIKYPQAAPDKGTLKEDLGLLLRDLVKFLNRAEGGKVYAAFLNAAIRSPKLAELRGEVSRTARVNYHTAVARSIERGELKPDTNTDLLIEAMIAPFVYRRLGSPANVPVKLVDQIIDIVLEGHLIEATTKPAARGK